ncbi:unnamed protein product [Symbiodinium sp. CCMP2456]|nr:unnamed protein product [Symbiodinium sp. CCMP2456]
MHAQTREDPSQMQPRLPEQGCKCTDLHALQAEMQVLKSEQEAQRLRHEAALTGLADKQLEAQNQLEREVLSWHTTFEQHKLPQQDSQEVPALPVAALLQKLAKLEQKTAELEDSLATKAQRQREMELTQLALQKQLEDEAAMRKEMFQDLDNKLSQHIERHYCVQDRIEVLEQVIGGTDETMVDEAMSELPFTQRLRNIEQLVSRESVMLTRLNYLDETMRDAWEIGKNIVAKMDGLRLLVKMGSRDTEKSMYIVDRLQIENKDLVERVHRLERQFCRRESGEQALIHRTEILEKMIGVGDSFEPARESAMVDRSIRSEACTAIALASSVEKADGTVSQTAPVKVSLRVRIELLESWMKIEQTLTKRVDTLECCLAENLGQAAEAETLKNRQAAAARARAARAKKAKPHQGCSRAAVRSTRKRRHG